ncbi:MAG: sugar transferase [Verrucomicrobiota bacterium]
MKRILDLLYAVTGLLLLAPLLLLVAGLIKWRDGGPVLFLQERVGHLGKRFQILKFRTMKAGRGKNGPKFTIMGDARVTDLGKVLRRSKIDELPQLWNVARGEMSMVGPRPEVPEYVELFSEEQKEVLRYAPGITGLATLEFRNEEHWLGEVEDPERVYLNEVIPRKIELNLKYAEVANCWQDFKLILRTVVALFDMRSVPRRNEEK